MDDLFTLWRSHRARAVMRCDPVSGGLLLQVGAALVPLAVSGLRHVVERFVVHPDGRVQAVVGLDAAFARETCLRERLFAHIAARRPRTKRGSGVTSCAPVSR